MDNHFWPLNKILSADGDEPSKKDRAVVVFEQSDANYDSLFTFRTAISYFEVIPFIFRDYDKRAKSRPNVRSTVATPVSTTHSLIFASNSWFLGMAIRSLCSRRRPTSSLPTKRERNSILIVLLGTLSRGNCPSSTTNPSRRIYACDTM